MLDEIDKLGMDFRGDPASALLEVLDPEQNGTFRDHYLDVAFDLSRVLFVTTANVIDTVPAPLRDRMEIIHLAGYTEEEKVAIAQTAPRAQAGARARARRGEDIEFTPEALRLLARGYTREAGVRSLEREIASVCRKVARRRAEGQTEPTRITPDARHRVPRRAALRVRGGARSGRACRGSSTGLAWTPAGGDILFVEATRMPGKRTLTLTGQLGDVMKESAQAALSWVRRHAGELGIAARLLGEVGHPRPRPGRGDPQGRAVGGRDDGHRAGVAADAARPVRVGSGDDGRGQPVRPGAAGRRASRRRCSPRTGPAIRTRDAAAAEREEPLEDVPAAVREVMTSTWSTRSPRCWAPRSRRRRPWPEVEPALSSNSGRFGTSGNGLLPDGSASARLTIPPMATLRGFPGRVCRSPP